MKLNYKKIKKKLKQLEQNSYYKKMLEYFPDIEIVKIKSLEEDSDD